MKVLDDLDDAELASDFKMDEKMEEEPAQIQGSNVIGAKREKKLASKQQGKKRI